MTPASGCADQDGGGQGLEVGSPAGTVPSSRCRGLRLGRQGERPGGGRGDAGGAVPADRGFHDRRQQGGAAAAGAALAGGGARGPVGGREDRASHQDAVPEVRGVSPDLRPERRPLVPGLHQDRVPGGPAAHARAAPALARPGGPARRRLRLHPAGARPPAAPPAPAALPAAPGPLLTRPPPTGGDPRDPAGPTQPDPDHCRPRL